MKFEVLCIDNPWNFLDKLTMSDVKRSAESQYAVMSNKDLLDLKIKDIAADNAVLALWTPSSLLPLGLECMENYGFSFRQTVIWAKTVTKLPKKIAALNPNSTEPMHSQMTSLLGFGMGRLFRQSHEVALIGIRGKPYKNLKNKSQRSVIFAPNLKHSAKPEEFQDSLEKMFSGPKCELFARRDRVGWVTAGNQCPSTLGEDIRDSIERIKNL